MSAQLLAAVDLPADDGQVDVNHARISELCRAHLDFVWRLLRRLGLSAAAADDASQRVFMTLARRIADVAVGSERSFVFGVALREARDQRRSERRRREDPIEFVEPQAATDGVPRPDELLERKRATELLDRLLAELPDELRHVFVLYEIEGLTTPEIAELCELPLGTAASRLRRARDHFTRTLAAHRRANGGMP